MYSTHRTQISATSGFIAALFLVMAPDQAQGCVCRETTLDTESAYERSDAVFLGTVRLVRVIMYDPALVESAEKWVEKLGVKHFAGRLRRSVGYQYILEITEAFKGNLLPMVPLESDGDCGFLFMDGVSYLVYANYSTRNQYKVLSASICGRTRSADRIGREPERLRKIVSVKTESQ